MKAWAGLLGLCGMALAACHEATVPPAADNPLPRPPSAAAIAAERERHFAAQLPLLQARHPEAEARAALAKGERYLLCNGGRSDTVPGITAAEYAKVAGRCEVRCLDGVTDALYGEQHRQYVTAALEYSARWNKVMLPACQAAATR